MLVIFLSPRNPLASAFLGFNSFSGVTEAEVTVTNISSANVQCYCLLASTRRGPQICHEVRRPYNLTLPPNACVNLAVTVPPGTGIASVSCEALFVGRHNPIVRSIGCFLERAGLYVYHDSTQACPRVQGVILLGGVSQTSYARGTASTLKLQIGGAKPADSLSDYLVFRAFTNSWSIR